MTEDKKTQVQFPQGGFEGRRRQAPPPPLVKEAIPEKYPPEVPPPAGEPSYAELVKRLLDSEARIIEELVAIREGLKPAEKREEKYYNTPLTAIAVATPDPPAASPLDPNQIANAATGQTGYQVEGIYTQLQRIAPKITVINDGTSNLFVISTPDGTYWSREAPILTGEARTFFNVWELRLRSPTVGNLSLVTGGIYRVTEYEFWLAYSANVNKASFDARVVNAPVAGALLSAQLGGTIQVPNGFALVLRATVGNAGQVYIAQDDPTIANSGINRATGAIAGRRITLNAGDSARLFIKNTDPVAIAGSAVLQNLDVLVEQ